MVAAEAAVVMDQMLRSAVLRRSAHRRRRHGIHVTLLPAIRVAIIIVLAIMVARRHHPVRIHIMDRRRRHRWLAHRRPKTFHRTASGNDIRPNILFDSPLLLVFFLLLLLFFFTKL